MPKICSCLPCDTKHGTQAQYGHMYSTYSVVTGGGVWSVALGCLGHHTPYIRTYAAAAAPQKQRCSLHHSAAAATSYSTVVLYSTVWYSMVHTGCPTTDLCCRSLAAAERGAATASPLWATDAYLHIYNIYNIHAPTYLRRPGTGTFQTKSPEFASMTCQFTCQHMAVDILFELRNLLILVASSQMSKTNEI